MLDDLYAKVVDISDEPDTGLQILSLVLQTGGKDGMKPSSQRYLSDKIHSRLYASLLPDVTPPVFHNHSRHYKHSYMTNRHYAHTYCRTAQKMPAVSLQ